MVCIAAFTIISPPTLGVPFVSRENPAKLIAKRIRDAMCLVDRLQK